MGDSCLGNLVRSPTVGDRVFLWRYVTRKIQMGSGSEEGLLGPGHGYLPQIFRVSIVN